MTHGVGVVVGNGGLETVDAVQALTIVTDRQIGSAACLAGNCQRDGLLLGEADVVSGSCAAADAAVLAEEAVLELEPPQADRARAAAATALPLSMDLLVIFFIVSLLLFR